MSRSFTLGGQSGTIPYDVYLRKIERSNVVEDPDLYEKHIRRELADFRPDVPFHASDQPREDTHSRELLSLRYEGGRSDEDPYLPDGTFLDHEFLERDPRGVTNEPDFNKVRPHSIQRASMVKFSNDSDYSVPETGINPVQMRTLIRDSQQQFKDRWTNFDESMDGWTNGGAVKAIRSSSAALVTLDGTILNLTEASARNRIDAVSLLSNRTPGVLRYNTPDHRVKISRYGRTRPVMNIGANKWNNNRQNAYLDHQIPIQRNGQYVNRMLGLLMMDLEGQRVNKQVVAQGAQYNDSAVNQVAHKQLNPEDIYKLMRLGITSNAQSAHDKLQGHQANRAVNQQRDQRETLNESVINHKLAQSMTQVNKAAKKLTLDDLRDEINNSAAHLDITTTAQNKSARQKQADNLKGEIIDNRSIEESKEIKTYRKALVLVENKALELADLSEFNQTCAESYKTLDRKQRLRQKKAVNVDSGDTQIEEFGEYSGRYLPRSKLSGRTDNSDIGEIDNQVGPVVLDREASINKKIKSYNRLNSETSNPRRI